MSLSNYTVSFGKEGFRYQDVIYQEDGLRLDIYLETSGDSLHSDLVGGSQGLERWTEPAGLTIPPEKQQEIATRIKQWGLEQKIRIDFTRGLTREENHKRLKQEGWTLINNPDGTVTCLPPNYKGKS